MCKETQSFNNKRNGNFKQRWRQVYCAQWMFICLATIMFIILTKVNEFKYRWRLE